VGIGLAAPQNYPHNYTMLTEFFAGSLPFFLAVLSFIAVIVPLIVVHEFGHYWVAKKCGVHVETFSIGFGKPLFSFKDKSGTEWRIAPYMLGGYVRLFGDSDPTSAMANPALRDMPPEQKAKAFFSKSVGQRAAIVAAGPGINFAFALLLLYVLFIAIGQPFSPAKVTDLVPGLPAEKAGILVGDEITAMNGQSIASMEDLRKFMLLNLDNPVDVALIRNGQPATIHVVPRVEIEGEEGMTKTSVGKLGIIAGERQYKQHGPVSAVGAAFKTTYDIASGNLIGIWQIITGERSRQELSSVITIAKISQKAVSDSLAGTVAFVATLSIVLGVINLFPIPALDGGHLMFYAIEAIRRRPLSEAAQEYSLRIGFGLILTLMAFALWNDLVNNGWFDKLTQLLT